MHMLSWRPQAFKEVIIGFSYYLSESRIVEGNTKDAILAGVNMGRDTDCVAAVAAEIIWKIMHKRWDIEENGFHILKTYYHDHCFIHNPIGIEAAFMFMIMAFNLSEMFMFKCLRNFREKKCSE